MAHARVWWPSRKQRGLDARRVGLDTCSVPKLQQARERCSSKAQSWKWGIKVACRQKKSGREGGYCQQIGLMRIIIVTLPSEDFRPSPPLGPAGSRVGRLGHQLAVSGVSNLRKVSKLDAQQGHQSHGQLQQPSSTLAVRHVHSQVHNSKCNKSCCFSLSLPLSQLMSRRPLLLESKLQNKLKRI